MQRAQKHMWTKEQINVVKTQWNTKTATEICNELNIQYQQLAYIVKQMRLAGFNLPRKHVQGNLQSLLKECLLENN